MLEINPELRSSAPPSKEGLSAVERVNDIMMKGVGKIKAKLNFCVSIPSRVATRASVVFSEPLHGGSSEEWVTGLTEVRDRFQGGIGPAQPTGRQAQGFSEDHTGSSASHSSTPD